MILKTDKKQVEQAARKSISLARKSIRLASKSIGLTPNPAPAGFCLRRQTASCILVLPECFRRTKITCPQAGEDLLRSRKSFKITTKIQFI
jgi:hypothetical protein